MTLSNRTFRPKDMSYMTQHLIPDNWVDSVIEGSSEIRTIVHGAQPVAVMGITPLCDGVASIWSVMSQEAGAHPTGLVRQAKELIEYSEEKFNLHRIQTCILSSDGMLMKWAEMIGLSAESVMYMAAPNMEDFIMYAKLRRH